MVIAALPVVVAGFSVGFSAAVENVDHGQVHVLQAGAQNLQLGHLAVEPGGQLGDQPGGVLGHLLAAAIPSSSQRTGVRCAASAAQLAGGVDGEQLPVD